MKISGHFLLLLTFLTLPLCGTQAQPTADELRVNQAVIRLFDGLAALDASLMKQYTTPDFLLLENGAVWTMDTLLAKVAPLKSTNFSRINHLDFIRTEVTGNTAWVAYHNRADMVVNGQPSTRQWLESASLVKQGNDWQISLLHSTVVSPAKGH